METILFFIGLAFVGAIVWGLIKRSEAKESARKRGQILKEKFMKMKDFIPSQRVVGLENRYIFAVDQTRRKVAYIEENTDLFLPYDKFISVEIREDNTTIASKSSSRTIGGAIVGGAIAGGAGAIVGGLSGDTTMKKNVSLVQVRIRLRDISSPTLLINCFDCMAMFGSQEIDSGGVGGWAYKEGMEHARQIADLVSVIIDDVDRQEKQNVSTPTVSGSVAEELSKLAELKEKGILTDDEFKEQKKKLLG